MNEYDDILNRIVEEFYDTGRLVLNESLYGDTLDVFHNLKNNPKTIDEILKLYNRLFDFNKEFINKEYVNADETYGIQIEDFINAITDIKNNLINLPRDINTLKSLLSRIDTIKEDGVNFTEEEIGEINKKIGNLEYKEKKKETDKIRGSGEVTTIQTPERAKESRQSEIKETNKQELPVLYRDYEGDKDNLYKSNLRTLQYTLKNNTDLGLGDVDKSNLETEIENSEFGQTTEDAVILFQASKNLEETGIVDIDTWNHLMESLRNSENRKLDDLLNNRTEEVDSDLLNDIKSYAKIDDDNFSDSKKELFQSLSLKLFSNLVNKQIYTGIKKKGLNDTINNKTIKDIFLEKKGLYEKQNGEFTEIKKLEGEIEELENGKNDWLNSDNAKNMRSSVNKDRYIETEFDAPIEEKEKKIKEIMDGVKTKSGDFKVDQEDIKFWRDIISKWGKANREEREKILQDYVDYRNKRESIEFFFEKLIKRLKESLKNSEISINEANELIQSVNHAIYTVYHKEGTDQTKKNKIKYAIKDIIKDTDLEGGIFDLIDGLRNINIRKIAGDAYEKSFCECNTKDNSYFIGCNSKYGDQSYLFPNAVQQMKTYLGGVNGNSGHTQCSQEIYQLIINSATTKADKYDIISDSVVNLTNGTNIPNGKKIEVKKYDKKNEYTLSEFIGLYKKRADVEIYRNQNNNHFIKYNDIIREVVRLLNEDDNGLANTFKGEDSLYGVFVGDYQFYKYDQIDLFWSTQSDQTRGGSDELRLTLKFKIKDGQTPSQWVEGNCNIQQNESTDRLDNIIENFFDTGKFVF
jgi:hypothetical protein